MKREKYLQQMATLFKTHPIVALLGPRQCGKTTLAHQFIASELNISFENKLHYFDLEDPEHLAQFEEPKLTLQDLKGFIVIDEIQRAPELFPLLRVLVDKNKDTQRFLILGSASRVLLQQSSESLAGRIAYLEVTPFAFTETQEKNNLWIRGGFPRSYLAETDPLSFQWRTHYILTFLERDIPALGIRIAPQNLRRFWMMLSNNHGGIFNASDIARSLQISSTTTRHYLDILTGTFMIRELPPWFENIKKRQIKSPKIYFRDSGILHHLLNIHDHSELLAHPKLGASWEGFALEEIIRFHHARQEDCFFWATHTLAELDLMILDGSKKCGFEFKYTAKPKLTSSLLQAKEILNLDSLVVIYPGTGDFLLHESGTRAIGLERYLGIS